MTTNGTEERQLPDGWTKATLRQIISSEGVFSDGDWVESKDQDPDGNVRLIQLADIGDGFYRDRSNRFLTSDKAKELNCTFLQKGDVLVARMPDPLGRACIFPGDEKKSVTVVDVCIVRTGLGESNHRWLMHWINTPIFRSEIEKLQSGTTRKRISRKNLATIEFPVPPLPEQERIVAEIEKQFTRLDQAVASLRRLQSNLARYKASVLKAACEGRLVPQDPADESADQLLARILAERRAQWQAANPGKKYKEPVGVEENTAVLPDLPEGWVWASLESISDAQGGYAFRSKDYSEDGYQILKIGNVKMNRLDLGNRPSFIRNLPYGIIEKYLLKRNDIVITLTGTRKKRDYGFVALVKNEKDLLLNQRVARLRFSPLLDPNYCLIALQSQVFQDRFFSYETGNVGQGNVGMRAITLEPIALPPLAEQERIVAEVERRLSVVTAVEQTITANLSRTERLRQSILHRAFTGQLVPQEGVA